MAEFFLKILVPGQLSSRKSGEQFLRLIMRHFPDAIPERFGTFEPLTNKFDRENIDRALDLWGTTNFIAARRQPEVYFMVTFWPVVAKKRRHSSLSFLRLEAHADSVCRFLTEVFESFSADYAIAHPLTRVELEERIERSRERIENGPLVGAELSDRLKKQIAKHGYASMTRDQLAANIERVTRIARGGPELADREVQRLRRWAERRGFASVLSSMIIAKFRIEKCLPDLFWLNVFGRPYIELFGRERMLSTPATQVRELTNGLTLRVTERLEDDALSWSRFKTARDECRSHLDSNAFFDQAAPAGHRYNTPNFVFV
jgi:hypothetical protein